MLCYMKTQVGTTCISFLAVLIPLVCIAEATPLATTPGLLALGDGSGGRSRDASCTSVGALGNFHLLLS